MLSAGRIIGAYKVGYSWVIPLYNGLPEIRKGSRGPKLGFQKKNPGPMSTIYINRNQVRDNKNKGENEPVISVNQYNSNQYGHEAIIEGPARIIYDPENSSNGGATVWIELIPKLR